MEIDILSVLLTAPSNQGSAWKTIGVQEIFIELLNETKLSKISYRFNHRPHRSFNLIFTIKLYESRINAVIIVLKNEERLHFSN